MDEDKYIEVEVSCKPTGAIIPLAIVWKDGRRFEIDEIIDVRRQASLKAGGAGIRFVCMVKGERVNLYMEDIEFNRLPGARWFIESK